MADSAASLLEQVHSGRNRQLQVLAADGLLPLPAEQLIPLQVGYASGADPELARRAAAALAAVDARVAVPFLAGGAGPEVLAYFARRIEHPLVLETVLRRRDVPRPLLIDLARRLPADLQEVLILRQDAIVEEPAILQALEENPQLSLYAQRRIAEYREHLLPRARRPVEEAPPEEEIDDDAFAAAVAQARAAPAVGEVDETTGLSEGQVRMLPVSARLRLARGAGRLLRSFLLRDPNPRVALSVLAGTGLSEQEIEQVARSRNVSEEVLEEIARRREWVAKHAVVRALVSNPRTPVGIGVRLVSRLGVRELREVSRDRNIPDAVRSTALRLYRIKRQ
ncbi:MAG TPA: hypothetical protein VIH93_06865 [Thermoanaerobaculia bacterium]